MQSKKHSGAAAGRAPGRVGRVIVCGAAGRLRRGPGAAAGLGAIGCRGRRPSASAAAAAPTVRVKGFDVQGNTLLKPAAVQQRLAALRRPGHAAAPARRRRRSAGDVPRGRLRRRCRLPARAAAGRRRGCRRHGVAARGGRQADAHRHHAEPAVQRRPTSAPACPRWPLGRTPDVRRIDAEIQLANENPAKTVQVLLQPGTEPATIAAQVTVAEQPVQRFSARWTTPAPKRDGRWRAALGWQHANVFGPRPRLRRRAGHGA